VFDDYASDPAVAKYMTWTPHRSVDDTKEFLSRCERTWIEGSAFPWCLWYKQDGAFVGLIEVRVRASAADLGYALARRWWRQGLMSEAVTAMVEWALGASDDLPGVGDLRTSTTWHRRAFSNEWAWSVRGCFVGGWCIRT
jgi:RimJ/RimL family protein N-acetyltransferase